jgi:hypothetical protein
LLTITDVAGVEQIAREVITRPPRARSLSHVKMRGGPASAVSASSAR